MRPRLALLTAATVGSAVMVLPPAAIATPAGDGSGTAPEAVAGDLLVGYDVGATTTDRAHGRDRAHARFAEQVVRGSADRREVELVRLPAGADPEQAIAQLESDPAVAYAEPNWVMRTLDYTPPTDPYFTNGSLWGMYGGDTSPHANANGSNAAAAWPTYATATGTAYIGVIDEGIQYTHPDLTDQVRNPGEAVGNGVDDDSNGYVDDAYGWDFANNDNTVYDGGSKGNLDDHGTHVSGTMAGLWNGSGVVGVAHRAHLISGKFLGRNGGTLANAVKAVNYFTDLKTRDGINIVATSNSWGGGGFSQSLLDAIVAGAQADILFVAAAGNSGSDNDSTPSYPSGYNTAASAAGYDAVIAVAAIDSAGALASFSQYGATTVDLGAPGVDIWSSTAYDKYSLYSGTSMATPHVSGAAALFAAVYPDATATQIKTALLAGAAATASLNGKTLSGGRLDVEGAVLAGPFASFTPGGSSGGGGGGGTGTATLTVTAGAKLKNNTTPVTAAWSGFSTDTVTVTRGGASFAAANPGSKTENWRGSGTVTYTVCDTSTAPLCKSASTTI